MFYVVHTAGTSSGVPRARKSFVLSGWRGLFGVLRALYSSVFGGGDQVEANYAVFLATGASLEGSIEVLQAEFLPRLYCTLPSGASFPQTRTLSTVISSLYDTFRHYYRRHPVNFWISGATSTRGWASGRPLLGMGPLNPPGLSGHPAEVGFGAPDPAKN